MDGKLADYITKGKQLTSEYLCAAFSHILMPPTLDLGVQVGRLSISQDIFVGKVLCYKTGVW